MEGFWSMLVAWGVPAAISATIVGITMRRIEKRLNERKRFEHFQVRSMMATMKLCEANAIALQNGKCNGETHGALAYMNKVKQEEKDFLISQGIDHIF